MAVETATLGNSGHDAGTMNFSAMICGMSASQVTSARLLVYAGAPHGLATTHKDKLNADLLAFLHETR